MMKELLALERELKEIREEGNKKIAEYQRNYWIRKAEQELKGAK